MKFDHHFRYLNRSLFSLRVNSIKNILKMVDGKQEQVDELKFLIDSPIDFDYIVRIAREKLGLHFPDETIFHKDANE